MSRIGKKPIDIKAGVQIRIDGQHLTVTGPKGELSREVRPEIALEQRDDTLLLAPRVQSRFAKALWGLTRTLISNMIQGVTQGYERRLQMEGVGYRATQEGDSLVLNVGFSHPVKIKIPEHVRCTVDKDTIVLSGIDKDQVGQIAAKIRRVRPPEPYKGKGIRYEGEVVRRKLGKKAATSVGGK